MDTSRPVPEGEAAPDVVVEPPVPERPVGDATEVAPPKPEPREEPAAPPQEREREEVSLVAESAENVADLMEAWVAEVKDKQVPEARRRVLAWRLVKLEQGLQRAHLKPDHVKIAEAESGVLGFYVPESEDIYLTPEGLGDAEHYDEILVHEQAHASGLADEGAAQLETRRKVASARRGIYLGEQLKVEQRFDVPDLLKRYSIDRPDKLVAWYLEEELAHGWESWGSDLETHLETENRPAFRSALGKATHHAVEGLADDLVKILPRLAEEYGTPREIEEAGYQALEKLYRDREA